MASKCRRILPNCVAPFALSVRYTDISGDVITERVADHLVTQRLEDGTTKVASIPLSASSIHVISAYEDLNCYLLESEYV